MQFRAFEPGIEVNGQTAFAIVDGFNHYRQVASRFLLDEGIGTRGVDGVAIVDPAAWYPQEAWLRAFENIARKIGELALFQIGEAIPRNAKFPPWVTDIQSAVQSIDIAYHMNHRKAGREMFDPVQGKMLEGIGHYGWEPVAGERRIVSVCENPYPCSFDRGILTTMATKFEPRAKVVHVAGAPCRRSGDVSCTYHISW